MQQKQQAALSSSTHIQHSAKRLHIEPEPVTRYLSGLVEFFSKKATFKLSLMANDENKFLPIF